MINYNFTHLETALTAFTGVFEKKLQKLIPNIPVLFIDNGDEVYFFKKKFETEKENQSIKDITLKIPRCVLNLDSIELETDQDTNQYIKIPYIFNNKTYQTQARRKAINFPINCKLVSSNLLFALSYYEMLLSILSIDNVFTYEFNGNTYQSSFSSDTISLEKNTIENGGTKNYLINFTIKLQLQPYIIRTETITEISNDSNKFKTVFQIDTRDSNNDLQTDFIIP